MPAAAAAASLSPANVNPLEAKTEVLPDVFTLGSEASMFILHSKSSARGESTSFVVDQEYATIAKLIQETLEFDSSAVSCPASQQVEAHVLERIVRYMNHCKGTEAPWIATPLRDTDLSKLTNEQDAKFIDDCAKDHLLFEVILAANYLGIEGLLHLALAKLASLIKSQPLEQIKSILEVQAGLAEEKEEKTPAAVRGVLDLSVAECGMCLGLMRILAVATLQRMERKEIWAGVHSVCRSRHYEMDPNVSELLLGYALSTWQDILDAVALSGDSE